jgi:F-type H+-transporting ATPase subunit b
LSFSWTTFIVEIVNFIVLMWLLTRFLYRPIAATIAARQDAIRKQLEEANALKSKGEELQQRYETRLHAWEDEKASLRTEFERALADERVKREADLEASLKRERDAAMTAERARDQETLRRLQDEADRRGAEFCATLLSRFASPELEAQIVQATLADLQTLPSGKRALLARANNGAAEARITTRYPVPEDRRREFIDALHACAENVTHVDFQQDEHLVAGVHIDLGAVSIEGNLAEELAWFASGARNGA